MEVRLPEKRLHIRERDRNMVEMLSFEFMRRALLAGLMVGLVCSSLSFFVVAKRLSFLGHGIAHASLGGVALGLLLGLNPVATAGIFAIGIAWLVGTLTRRSELHEDAIVGVLSSAGLAFGVALMSLSKSYTMDLPGYLFGNILAVSWDDIIMLGASTALVLGLLTLFFRELLYVIFDEEWARAGGIPVDALYYMLILAIALTIVVGVKTVGVVLVGALLVIPASTGRQLARNFRGVLAVSMAAGVVSAFTGLFLSYEFDLPSGAMIVLCSTAIFLLSTGIRALRTRKARIANRKIVI